VVATHVPRRQLPLLANPNTFTATHYREQIALARSHAGPLLLSLLLGTATWAGRAQQEDRII